MKREYIKPLFVELQLDDTSVLLTVTNSLPPTTGWDPWAVSDNTSRIMPSSDIQKSSPFSTSDGIFGNDNNIF